MTLEELKSLATKTGDQLLSYVWYVSVYVLLALWSEIEVFMTITICVWTITVALRGLHWWMIERRVNQLEGP